MSSTITINGDRVSAYKDTAASYSAGVNVSDTSSSYFGLMRNPIPAGSYRPKQRKTVSSPSRVVRRLNGFYLQEEGEEVRVAFVEKNQLVHYYLPAKLLKEGGVDSENQPFEMDELETEIDGVKMKGYRVKATAKIENTYTEPLDLADKTKSDLDYILSNFKDA